MLMALLVTLALVAMSATASAEEGFAADLTDEQIGRILNVTDEFHQRQFDLLSLIQVKYQAMLMELQRKDAFTAKTSSANYKRLVRELGKLAGQ